MSMKFRERERYGMHVVFWDTLFSKLVQLLISVASRYDFVHKLSQPNRRQHQFWVIIVLGTTEALLFLILSFVLFLHVFRFM